MSLTFFTIDFLFYFPTLTVTARNVTGSLVAVTDHLKVVVECN
jgi:hypothetical protein